MTQIMNEVDLNLAKRLKFFRARMNWPLKTLASDLGISIQQLQRYEQGVNKIPASTLFCICKSMKIDISSFFESIDSIHPKREAFKIALVEDNANDEFLFRKALEDFPERLDIFVMRSGEEASNFFRNIYEVEYKELAHPDIIFLDLYLPSVRGLDLLQEIKRRPMFQNTPVIVLTSSINTHDMNKSYQLHASGFIRKSFSFQ